MNVKIIVAKVIENHHAVTTNIKMYKTMLPNVMEIHPMIYFVSRHKCLILTLFTLYYTPADIEYVVCLLSFCSQASKDRKEYLTKYF